MPDVRSASHFKLFADGTVHITGTIRSTFSVDVLPTDGTPDATGRTVIWFASRRGARQTRL
jgi:hypothetical protein